VLGIEEAARANVPLALTQSAVQMGMQTVLGKAVPAALVSSRATAINENLDIESPVGKPRGHQRQSCQR
jgi:hypothetical protein